MAEYIEREEIYRRWKEIPPEESLEGLAAGILHMSLAVVQTPAADVAPVVHGRWVLEPSDVLGMDFEFCSVCGQGMNDRNQFWNARFCPNCGAKMDLEG